MNLFLKRLTTSPATFGVLLVNGRPLCVTLELPPLFNQSQVSCIPAGTYECILVRDRQTPGGMQIDATLEVIGVPRRSGILFHIGNSISDTHGCILVGMEFDGDHIAYSKIAFDKFIRSIKTADSYTLTIENP